MRNRQSGIQMHRALQRHRRLFVAVELNLLEPLSQQRSRVFSGKRNPAGAVENLDDKFWYGHVAGNLTSVFVSLKSIVPVMRAQRSGRIVNITSPASRMALPNYLAYAASKAGVDAVTRGAAVALAPYGVTVNAVAPGMMDTPMQRITEQQLAALEGRNDFEVFLAERTRRIPLGRRTDCATVAATVVWLALDAPDYITAERLNASGGLDKD